MNSELHTLIAFMGTLAAIVVLALAGAYFASAGHGVEAAGMGAAVTGLIGVLGTFRPKSPTATTDSGVVNVNSKQPVEGEV
jgi:hypothetical protein